MARRVALLGVILPLLFDALFFLGFVHSDDSDCKRMQTAGAIGEKGILCVGQLTNDRLMVITRDWNVYQLPSDSFAPATNKLYLGDAKPVPIAEKWPQIASNADFKRVRPILYDAFFYANGDVNLFFMETKTKDPNKNGVTFNVDTQQAFSGFYWPGSNDVVLTSSYQVNKFYQFLETDGRLQLQLYKSNCTDPTSHNQGVCALNPRKVHGENYYVCQKGDKEVTLKTSQVDCTSVNWPVLHGFLFKDKIYLFGSNYVITFPEAVYDKPDQPVEVQTVPYGTFIQCGGGGAGRDGIVGKKHQPLSVGLIVAIVLLVLLIILCCILCLLRQAALRKKKKKKYGYRSDWLVGYGMLTKASPRRSSSPNVTRRSTQMSTAAGKLSKKGPVPPVVPPKPPVPGPHVPPVVPPKPPGPGPNRPPIVPPKPPGPGPHVPPVVPPKPPGPGPHVSPVVPPKPPGPNVPPGPSASRGSFQVTERSKFKGPSKGGPNNITERSRFKGHK